MASKTFKTNFGDGGIELPFDVRKEFGKARPPVKVTINGFTYRSTVSVYGGKYFIPVRKDRQEAAKINLGDICKVTVASDTEAREVDPPPDLKAAFAKNTAARAQWEKLSFTHKREHAEALLAAKKPETRARRLQKTLEMLAAKSK
jgi:Bacteriocin-protection, YdeI or OmpD-Associated/Domain of unknown function (DUF1905)